MKIVDQLHEKLVVGRRARVLSQHVSELLWPNSSVLDVGCGDGQIARLIQEARPDVTISGVDVLVREKTWVPVEHFDGETLPYADNAFDVVTFVDVLHHTLDPLVLLREAVRVARHGLVIKDHTRNGFLAGPTLQFMDVVGNRRHGVALPFNYWSKEQWTRAFHELNVEVDIWRPKLGIYRGPASWLFDRSLHFATRLVVQK